MSAIKDLIIAVKGSEAAMADDVIHEALGRALAELSGLRLSPHDLPTIRTGEDVNLRMFAHGGVPPYKFGVADATLLPPGLTLNEEDGVISGAARQPGGPFVIFVVDAEGGRAMIVPSLAVIGQVIADKPSDEPAVIPPPEETLEPVSAEPPPAPVEEPPPEAAPAPAEDAPADAETQPTEEPPPAAEAAPEAAPAEAPVDPVD